MAHIAAIGEVMVELAPFPIDTPETKNRDIMALSFAGDTYNTSVYMARLGLQTDYVTNLGEDTYSHTIMQRMSDENIGTGMIQCLPGRSPGLYIIRNTADGEREFFYWRKEAPARELFSTAENSEALFQKLKQCDCVYLSGITLAIIGEQSRQHLLKVLQQLRTAGVTVAFDSNYRPRLWRDKQEAQAAMLQIMQHTDIALLTLDDELLLWGDDTIEGCKARYSNCNLCELILKRGAEDAVIITANSQVHIPVPPVANVIDTTGAGDTFNAGYLAARLQNASAEDAARQGIRCAGIIIRHRGAVIERSVFDKELGA
ncbi:ketodeoxygluconokinase [Cellvibrio zantedeschiae]|uniref:Ketodeoxygluconokinase n=1 Tax=Cellvibrio zantedeschiae TaxID=1237077 RepID=A0ABQ3BCR8_9GAMM|nr:sugar kinase [Cellvibrio zantedeschiae]GGY86239.1 ketodeoxygluconokinase [Cellvibrio zantedeschiae]